MTQCIMFAETALWGLYGLLAACVAGIIGILVFAYREAMRTP
jgi:hypothetical protein